MNIKQFIEEITQGGAKLWVEGDDLCCEGSSGVLTPEVLDILKQHKTELLSLLRKAVTEPEEYPLSHGQQALWFVHQNAIDSAAYNVAATLRICSKVDSAAMKRTFQFLLDRHPVLRAVFPVQDGQPHIRIQPKQNVWFETIDASDWNEEQLKQQVIQAYQRPYDLAQGPLMRVHMFSHTEQDHVLLITVHHIVFDGWSLWLFMDEFSQTYPAIAMGQTPALPKLQYSYRDYVQWQTDILAGPEGERLWQYWQKQLSGELPVLQLPTDRPRPPVQTYHGATHFFQLDETLTQQLKVLAQTFDTTLFSLLLATFQILLYRYTGQDDILVGIPTAGRNNTNFSGIVGYFVNPVVLRTHCAGNPDFKTFLKKVRDTVLAAIDHQDYPFPLLVERLQPKRMPSYSPLFQVDFALQKAQVGDLTDFSAITSDSAVKMNLGGLEVKPFVIPQQEGQFDLTLEIIESGNALSGNFKYNIDLFNADTIERMIGHFKVLLKGIVQNPQQPITALPLLTAAEQQQLLAWNDTFVDYPHDKTIVNLFEEQVDKTPDAIAVVFEDQQLTYQELNTKANQLAHYLLNLKTGTDNCSLITDNCLVGICVERSLEMMIGLLGILKAGGAYVPLDPAYPAARLAFMLDDAQVPVLLTQSSLKEKLPETQALVVCLDAEAETFSQYRSENVASGVGPENLAYVIYTSGSTGKPKGVLVRHFNVARLFTATQSWFHFHERDVWTFFHSYAFDFSVWELWGALLYGGSLVVVPYWISRSPEAFYELLKTKGVTVLNQTPSAFRQLMTAEDQKGNRSDLNLRLVIFGGEALEFQSLTPWFERHGDQIPQLVNMYGITETTVHVTYRPLTLADLNSQGSLIGFPIPDLQAYMLDSHLQPTPIGIPGELHIGGAGLARGYLNRPELTAEKFIKNPFSDDPNSRLYKTGDLARYLPDGNIEYLGRIDNQVKMRGFRIELGEIEAILVQHPAVQENAVIVHELESGDKRLVACLVPNQGQTIDNTELRSFLKDRLPDYMIPSAFVTLEALPLTPNGKIDRRALSQLSVSHEISEEQFVAPRTPDEERLAGIWAEVLGIERVGVHDNFFELGGDSIISIQVISRANQAGLQLTPRQLFQHQTIAELARVAQMGLSRQAEQGLVTGEVPQTPIQHWFFEQQLPEAHHFNQAILLKISPQLTPEQLELIIKQLLQHHDVLRLRFKSLQGGIEQWITNNVSLITDSGSLIMVKDLSELSTAEQLQRIESTAAELQASLNLSEGPLLRVALFQLGFDKPNRLFFVIHHLAIDGVSWRILLEDFMLAYQQLTQSEVIALPPKTTSFQQWAKHLTEYAVSGSLNAELEEWLADVRKQVKSLPVDYPASDQANTIANTAQITVYLSVEQTRALLSEVPKAYRTQINDVFLTALVQSFTGWTGEKSLLIDFEGHGREELFEDVDLSRTVGWFTSLYPVLLNLRAVSNDASTALKTIKEQLRRIPNHGIGYGLLKYLNPEQASRLQALPQAQVSFNYLGQFQQFSEEPLLGLASEDSGAFQGATNPRAYLLDINGLISDDQLRIDWSYSKSHFKSTTVEHLAQSFITALQALIAHCQLPEARGYTPSDFPLARLQQTTLDKIVGLQQLDDLYPLSPMQEGMLFHTLYAPKSGVYFEQLRLTLAGVLNLAAFQSAWQQVVNRHAVLRAQCVWEGLEKPLQMVLSDIQLPWMEQDWRGLTTAQQDEQLMDFLTKERTQGFDLTQAPLMRCALIQIADQQYDFILSFHHLLMDGWCLPLILKDVAAFYESGCQGTSVHFEPARPYRDYLVWLQQQDIKASQRFWQAQLTGFMAPTQLRVDKLSEKSVPREDYEEQILSLAPNTTQALQSLAKTHHLTLNTLVQGAWALLLSRYSGEDNVVFGATVSGRPAALASVESMVGLFINTLPVRVAISPELLLLPWLKDLQAKQLERDAYSYTPLMSIQRWSDVSGGVPLFESLLVFENYPVDKSLRERGIGSLAISDVQAIEKTNYPLTLATFVSADELRFKMSYASNRFDTDTVNRMMGHLKTLLEGMITQAESRQLGEIPLLTKAEHQQLLAWNDTTTDYPHDKTIIDLFEEQVDKTPDAIAVVFEDQQLTYRQLNQKANQLAHYLLNLKSDTDNGLLITDNGLVGICIERSLEMVIGLLGILKAGGAYVPLDPAYPAARLAFMLEDAQVPVLLTQSSLTERLPETQAQVVCLDAEAETLSQKSSENLVSGVGPENLAYVIYTSGSTGNPKGVAIEHRNVVALLEWSKTIFTLEQISGTLVSTSLNFDVSVFELFVPLSRGGKIILVENILSLSMLSENAGVIMVNTVPSAMKELIKINGIPASVRVINLAGEPFSIQLLQELYRINTIQQVFNIYGPTEDTVYATFTLLSQSPHEKITIGHPITNAQTYILDRNLQPIPIGVPGELHISGAGLARGYLNRPDLTAEKFIQNPFNPKERLYKTGDLARYLPDGNIEYLGRIDNQVKMRGFRIELGEIEAVLAQYPAIREVVTIVREDQPDNKRLVAYIVPKEETALTPDELRPFLKAKLPDYMVPKAFVILEAFPLTPNGKIDRHALPAPEQVFSPTEETSIMPQTDMERSIATVWQEVLHVDKVGIYDNFFDLGGHSLLIIQIQAKLQKAFAKQISVVELFEHPTIHALAQHFTLKQTKQITQNRADNRRTRQTSLRQQRQARQKHRFKR
ncbi:MAG: hypothetical protein DRR16_10450 [Candidatus Parabeggiatoa sp. nov. 3]|nr:MAG: hypothetical protein DRR00_18675 [Gammaproteobacteria bacterium]RKZ86124.1 MAG: hypothetical protein DRR16_10450 [Gammaproteobacteria bacterium]HEW98429.1 amino acid adenylation domain-containing protein [Beggiatoa sp.]